MKRQGFGAAEITQALEQRASYTLPEGVLQEPVYEPVSEFNEPVEDYFAQQSDNDFVDDLTEEDRLYLRLKWGKTYKPEEWVKLE